jgi:hypothetical protein
MEFLSLEDDTITVEKQGKLEVGRESSRASSSDKRWADLGRSECSNQAEEPKIHQGIDLHGSVY